MKTGNQLIKILQYVQGELQRTWPNLWQTKTVVYDNKTANVIRNHTFQFSGQHRQRHEVGTGQLWTQCSEAKDQCSEEWQWHLSQTPAQSTTSNNTWLINAHTQLATSHRNLTNRNASQRTCQKPSRAIPYICQQTTALMSDHDQEYRPAVTVLG